MKRNGAALSMLLSAALGIGATGYLMTNYQTPAPTQYVTTVANETDSASPTPTEAVTPTPGPSTSSPGVEGDDGSLGGPVYDESHQATPTYVYTTPSEEPMADTTPPMTEEPTTPTPTPTDDGVATPASREKAEDGRDIVRPVESPRPSTPTETPSASVG